jgi:hypothetical protein
VVPFLIAPLVVVGGVLWWAFVVSLIGLTSGWWSLSRSYRARDRFEGTRFGLCSARIGWSNYGGCLTVGVNADGLHLAIFFPWRPGHPPLFVPWADVDAVFTKGWWTDFLDLRFRQVPNVRLRFRKRLGLKIAAAANRSWTDPEPASPTS